MGLIVLIIFEIIIEYFGLDQLQYISGLNIYLVGCYVGLNCNKYLDYRNKKISAVSCVYIAVGLLSAFKVWNLCIEIILFIAIWFACDFLSMDDKKLPWWMSITFFMYVAHDILLEVFEKIILIVFGIAPVFALLDYIFMPWIVVICLILISWILQKYMPDIWKLLTGNRGYSGNV